MQHHCHPHQQLLPVGASFVAQGVNTHADADLDFGAFRILEQQAKEKKILRAAIRLLSKHCFFLLTEKPQSTTFHSLLYAISFLNERYANVLLYFGK